MLILFVLSSGLTWFAWRRYREARAEIITTAGRRSAAGRLLLENRRLAQQYLQGQEAERKSLARELHDELGQYVNAIKTDAVSIQEKVADDRRRSTWRHAAIVRQHETISTRSSAI